MPCQPTRGLPNFLSKRFGNDSSVPSSFARPLTRVLDGGTLPLHCRIYLQLLSKIGKRPELLGASCTDVCGEGIFIRHLLAQRG
jgi:hypothetical protein